MAITVLGKVIGIFDSATKAIHHTECLIVVTSQSQGKMCLNCSLFRDNILRCRLNRHLKELNGDVNNQSTTSQQVHPVILTFATLMPQRSMKG